MIGDWERTCRDFHEQAMAECEGSLSEQLLALHRPFIESGQPVCRGCDQENGGMPAPLWPCRTYTIVASIVLHLSDIESELQHRIETGRFALAHTFFMPRASGSS